MKNLIKYAFKNIWSSKVFSIIIIFIIFLIGLFYTIIDSTSIGFNKSYNNVVENGNLHDLIIKEKFVEDNNSTYKLQIKDDEGKNLLNNSFEIKNSIENQKIDDIIEKIEIKKPNGSKKIMKINFFITSANGYFSPLLKNNLKNWSLIKEYISSTSDNDVKENFKEEIKKNLIEKKSYFNDYASDNQAKLLAQALKDIYQKKIDVSLNKSISVSIEKNAFNVVEFDINDKVNKIISYDGSNKLTRQKSDKEMENEINYQAKLKYNDNFFIDSSKGFRWSAQSSLGFVTTITDPSSFQAIIHPSYANENGKISITPQEAINIWKSGDFDKIISDQKIKKKYEKNLVIVDQIPFLIVGIGMKPDYIFPIINHSRPNPNIKDEAILFVNKRGYQRVKDSFRSNPLEKYLSIKVNNGDIDHIKNEITEIVRNKKIPNWSNYKGYIPISNWPKNIKIVTKYDEANDNLLLAQERVSFLKNLKSTIRTISISSTTLLIIFSATIIALAFGFVIKQKRKKMSTLLALGYNKLEIAFSLSIVAVILGAIPSMFSYIIGHFTQFLFIGIFDSYWTIPIYTSNFSIISLLVIGVMPFLLLFFIIFLITMIVLKENIIDMINNKENSFLFLSSILKLFKRFPIKFKYSVTLVLKNIMSVLVIALASISTITALMISFSSIGVAENALEKTKNFHNYEFKVNLFSPTQEGGNYNILQKNETSIINLANNHEPKFDVTYESKQKTTDLTKPHWHVPSIVDTKYSFDVDNENDPDDPNKLSKIKNYLKNKIQTQPLLNIPISGFEPWNIAKKLMPDNQVNISNKKYQEFLDSDENYKENANLKERVNDIRDYISKGNIPYLVSYNNIIIDKGDETYTYLDFDFNKESESNKYQILGVNENTNFLKFSQKNINNLKNNIKDNPILIGKFIKEKYNLDIGDKINIKIKNKLKRNFKNFKNNYESFKIVDIVDTYNDNEFYTLKSITDKIIGFDIKKSQINHFNGVFTSNEKSSLVNNITLYSPSGIYIGTDSFNSNKKWIDIMNAILNDNSLWKHKNDIASNLKQFVTKYSKTPYVASFNNITWKKINDYTFEQISKLSSNVLNVMQITSIIISILFSMIISSIIISNNKKRISTLWAMGYRKKEIFKIFMSLYVIPILISTIFSILLTISALAILKTIIMNFGYILIPFSLHWSIIFAPIILFSIFSISIFININWLKSDVAIKIFKE